PGLPPDDEPGPSHAEAHHRRIDPPHRVPEGTDLEIHRNPWRYTRLIGQQRAQLLTYRESVLHTDLADETLEEQAPQRYDELAEQLDPGTLATACREIVLYHVDELWAEHLAYLTELRESIHLHALARETPLDEFHRAAVPAFRDLLERAKDRAADTLAAVEVTADGVDLAASGVRRPTSTWTYLVHDNPFTSDSEQALKTVQAMMRKKKRR